MIQYQLLNLGLAFLEGFALILSPCILPILPIVLAGALSGNKGRLWGIMLGFVLVFSIITVMSRYLVQHLGVDPMLLRYIGFAVIVFFGLVLLSDKLSAKFSLLSQGISELAQRVPEPEKEGLWSGLILGGSLSLIWAPCGGPILAAALVQSAVQSTYLESGLILFAFALGSMIPMAIIALLGKQLIKHLQVLKNHAELIRKVMGGVMIVGGLAALIGVQIPSIDEAPMPNAPNVLMTKIPHADSLIAGLHQPYDAPALRGIKAWINSPPLSLEALKGKVVLIDFWTYSCINCIRTIPELNRWYAQYRDKGLEIIGVHTPEFEFEKNVENIKKAVEKLQIHYPIAVDSDYGTWLSFHNQYWPAQYLIDQKGRVVYQKFGEGNGEIMEHNIVALLGMPAENVGMPEKTSGYNFNQTPELYLGSARAGEYGGVNPIQSNALAVYRFPSTLPKDYWALSGTWRVEPERIISGKSLAGIQLHFNAGKVFAVMGTTNSSSSIKVKVFLNGELIGKHGGKDVQDSTLTVSFDGLYELASFNEATDGILILEIDGPGLAMYTFTFGD